MQNQIELLTREDCDKALQDYDSQKDYAQVFISYLYHLKQQGGQNETS